jgi:hypothetical protein
MLVTVFFLLSVNNASLSKGNIFEGGNSARPADPDKIDKNYSTDIALSLVKTMFLKCK